MNSDSLPFSLPTEPLLKVEGLPYPLVASGKVREVFDMGDALLMVATDRVSAFDVIMNEGLAGKGKWALGARLLRSSNTQQIDASASSATTTVRLTSLELVGQGRVLTFLGTEVYAMASAGRVHLGFSPDQITIDPGGLGINVDVKFEPVNEWIVGGGMAVRRDLATQWAAGLEIDRRVFSLETAHRNGNSIEYGRESFRNWSARLGLAWQYGR